jgi:hypothetical protein
MTTTVLSTRLGTTRWKIQTSRADQCLWLIGSFECLSPRDYVDTKFRLAYEQNHYSTHWVRSGSCYREFWLRSCCNRLSYLPCNLAPLDIKGGVEAPLEKNYQHNINCHEQYKKTRRMTIILREVWTCLKILASPVLPSISWSDDHPYSKSLSQIMTVTFFLL